MSETILKIDHVHKIYPGVHALNDVSFTINKGEVRAIIGENGAGKSTLIRSIMGVEQPDKGKVLFNVDGDWVTPRSAIESKSYGMYANYQHVNIAEELSVGENYFLGELPKTKLGAVNWKKIYKDSQEILDKFEMNIDPREKLANLPVAMQAMVTISKISVNDNIRLVIFDEPTALLENEKVEVLYRYIKELKAQGVSVIYISHRLEEIMDICDTVTVLKDGKYVDTKDVADVDKGKLISMMVGRELDDIYDIKHCEPGEELLKLNNISGPGFENVSMTLRRGEIVGMFGLVGAGRTEVMKAVFGASKLSAGSIEVKGKLTKINKPRAAMKAGIGFIPEDRRTEGLALGVSIRHNINISSYDAISKAGVINVNKERTRADDCISDLAIKTPSALQHVKNLSGGNQQKVVISKLLCCDPDVLIFDEPTVGVDVGAKEEIYKIIQSLTEQGKGVIIISSYLPEVMGLSDRMMIMSEGKLVGEMGGEELKNATENDVLRIASGLK